MHIGISCGGGWHFAERAHEAAQLGVTRCKFSCGIDGDPVARNAELQTALEIAATYGMQPIVDLRTSRNHIAQMAREHNEFGPVYGFISEEVYKIVARFGKLCSDWEWWGEPYCPHVTGREFTAFDYAKSLIAAHKAAHAADPDCRVWTGGFGVNMGLPGSPTGYKFLKRLIDGGAGESFEVCNLHPYAHGRDLGSQLAHQQKELMQMRDLLDKYANGQIFGSTEFGFPSVPVTKKPPWLHSYVLTQGVQGLLESDAPAWIDAFLGLYRYLGFDAVCVHTLDDTLPGKHWGDYCGLRRRSNILGIPYTRRKRQWHTVRSWAQRCA